MRLQMAMPTFSDAERRAGERLLKIAQEADRVEGYSEPHSMIMALLAEKIGARMGLHGSDLTALKFAALAHDLGERTMKRNYLLLPSPLGWEETVDLWRHPILGEQAAVELKLPRQVQLLVRWHHEWWNGMGYPDALSGEAIPLGARILRAVDTYCAMTSKRPHRPAHSEAEAEQAIADFAGIELDPSVAVVLLELLAEERARALETAGPGTVEPELEPLLPFDIDQTLGADEAPPDRFDLDGSTGPEPEPEPLPEGETPPPAVEEGPEPARAPVDPPTPDGSGTGESDR